MTTHDKTRRRGGYVFILIFGLLAAGIAAGGAYYYRNHERIFRLEVERQLSAIAELKVNELTRYRQERLEDADFFHRNPSITTLVRRYFEHPEDPEAGNLLRKWLAHIQEAHKYDRVMLLDPLYTKKMIVPDSPERITSFVSPSSAEVLRSGEIILQDFYWNERNRRIYLKVLVPIVDDDHGGRIIGLIEMRIDPETYLYPYISRWPTDSRTAETLLVRRDGNDALFLNELRFQKNTALRSRIPLKNTNAPAVKAVLGREGIVEGTDYRGTAVIAALRPVPGSPWFLVARMDAAEAFGPMRRRLREIIIITALLYLGAGGALGFVWRQQGARFYREQYEATQALRESESRLSAITDSARDAILMMDPEGRVTYWNPAAERVLGHVKAEALGRNLHELLVPQRYLEAYHAAFPGFMSTGRGAAVGQTLELRARRKDGREIDVALSLSAIRIKGAWHAVGIIRDITEQKLAEEALRESRRELSMMLSNLPGMAYRRRNDPLRTMDFISQGCLHVTGYSPEDLIGDARRSFDDLIHPDDREAVRQDVQASLEAREPFQLVYRLMTAEMKTKWIWEQGRGTYREDGTLAAIEGFMADITERRMMEEALKKARAELEEKNAELGSKNREMEKERALAHKVLESILQKDLRLPGLRTAVLFRPSRQIGGDFFDAWLLMNDQAHFLIGDISGHSISAALMMAVCKGMFHSLGHTMGDPLEIVSAANRMLCRMMSESQMFLTLVYARLDLKTGIVRLVSAGHNPVYLLDGTGAKAIESTGPALGWDPEDRWEAVEHRLPPGAMLFLYTDGLVEARDAQGREFGAVLPEKLLGHRSPRELTASILDELERFHQGDLEDDVTVLAISRDGDKRRLSLSFEPCFDRVDDVRAAVRETCADHWDLPESDPNITAFCQAVTELVNNAVEHSGASSIRTDIQFSGRETAFILTTDGPLFDPTVKAELPEPDPSGNLPEGGYGLAIIQRLVDGMVHEYRDGHNRVTLKKTFPTVNREGAVGGNRA